MISFSIPDQEQAWARINRKAMAASCDFSDAMLDGMWTSGGLGIHAMSVGGDVVGYLVLSVFDLRRSILQVMWCEIRPHRALRGERDWLWDAARYLEKTAALSGCAEVRIAVSEDHPSKSWLKRLRGVGFVPRQVDLGLSVAA